MKIFSVSRDLSIVKDGKIYLVYQDDTLIQLTFKLIHSVVIATELNGGTLHFDPQTNREIGEIILNESALPFIEDADYPEPDDEFIW